MLRYIFFFLLGLSKIATAQSIVQDEPLVMRLIFDDCLGYVVNRTDPFVGLTVFPLTPEIEETLPDAAFKVPNRVHVLSARYYAIWGQDDQTRYCMIQPVLWSALPALLGVDSENFVDRVSIRAAAEGMTVVEAGPEFDGLSVNSWREPGGDGQTELRMVVLPTVGSTGGIVDAGLIIVAAGKNWQRD